MNHSSIDWERALARLGGNEHLLLEVSRAFVRESQTRVEELHEALAQDDLDAIRRVAHTLKSSLAMLGAEPAHGLANRLELACGPDVTAMTRRATASAFEQELEQVVADVQERLE